ncbi:MAG: exodeoxyribonuclease VII small subunit [Burkholderiales bacterium]|nr:exodeoxyribonuclease VII small subunit [Phycisphaerae bacterium]
MAKNKQTQPKSFEEAVGELERILADMERGDVPLEESLSRYERGNYLLQYCRQVLGKAEQQIDELNKANTPAGAESAGVENLGAGDVETIDASDDADGEP